MSFDDFARTDRIFSRALDLEEEQRETYLRQACEGDAELERRVRELLAAEEQGTFSSAGAVAGPTWKRLADHMLGPAQGDIVGNYRVEDELGRGGMATVYRASRVDQVFDQVVALKILRPTPLSDLYERRFEQEREILGRLRHPNIAQIHDGGSTEVAGLQSPYFAMELVDGTPIDRHCESGRSSIRERLQLVLQIIEALKAAHRQLIVHRDLKPSNVLVTADGHVKLLDFGIAKVLEGPQPEADVTGAQLRVLTPQYASPEQMRGEPVSTATDVYQTGGLLYLLLSGQPPYDLSTSTAQEMLQAVCHDIPPLPSKTVLDAEPNETSCDLPHPAARWARGLRGDLDAIVMTALRKEPDRRYASIDELGDDIQRFLDGKAVRARGDSWSYRSRRWLGNHKLLAAGTAALLLYALTVTWMGSRWAAQRDAARNSAERAQAVTGFLESLLQEADPRVAGEGGLTALELLQRAPARLDQKVRADPELESTIRLLVGRVLINLGDEEAGKREVDQVVEVLSARSGGDQDLQNALIQARLTQASTLSRERHEEQALDLLAELEDELRARPDSTPEQRLLLGRLLETRSRALTTMGRRSDAVEPAREAITVLETVPAGADRLLLRARATLGNAVRFSGDVEEAVGLLRDSWQAHIHYFGADHPALLSPLRPLAGTLGNRSWSRRKSDPDGSRQDLAEVEALLERGIAISTKHYGNDNRHSANFFELRGAIAYSREDWEGAADAYSRARATHLEIPGAQADAAKNLMFIGIAAMEQGRMGEAVGILRDSLDEAIEVAGATHGTVAIRHYNLGRALFRVPDYAGALSHFQQAVDIYTELGAPRIGSFRETQIALADSHLKLATEAPVVRARRQSHLAKARELFDLVDLAEDDARWGHLLRAESDRSVGQ